MAGGLRPFLAAAFTVTGLLYLGWRTTTFNPDAPIVSAIFFATEVLGFLAALVVFFVSMRRLTRTPAPAPPGIAVDVFVTTLNEDLHVVRRTLVAATRITYPHVTWLLDDGDRAAFRALATELGCRYLARRQGEGAKAGNINNALRHASGEFVALLDADHCPQPNFLDRLLAYFADPAVAFVQTPQDYYNTGSFQHAFDRQAASIWHEQSGFHHVLQPGRDFHNATTLCGCSCVMRRAHLDLIGGFPEQTVTEDMHAAVRLQKLGLKSAFHDEPLAFGLAPPDFRGFLRQRLRWGEGNMQVCRLEGVPFSRHLTWRQNICYVLLAIAYADSWRKLILYVAPPLTLLLEIPPVYGRPEYFFLLFVPHLICATLAYSEFFGGFGRIVLTEVFDMARLSSGLASSWGLFRRHIRFRVSSKRLLGRSSPLLLIPQIAIAALCSSAIVATFARWIAISQGHRVTHSPLWLEAVLVGLCLVHLLIAVKVMTLARRSARIEEKNFIFDLPLPLRVIDGPHPSDWRWTRRLSLDMAHVTDLDATAKHVVELLLPDGPLQIDADIASEGPGRQRVNFRWHHPAQRDRLDQALHAGRWHRVLAGRHEVGSTIFERLNLLRPPPARTCAATTPWEPVVVRQADGRSALAYRRDGGVDGSFELIHFGDNEVLSTLDGYPILAIGAATTPMLDEGALDPLGAKRRAVRIAASSMPELDPIRPSRGESISFAIGG